MTEATSPEPEPLPLDLVQRFHLNFYVERVRWQTMRHMRRFAQRLVEADGSYSDLCVGPQEFRSFLGNDASPQAHAWLDQHGLPDMSLIEATLEALEGDLAAFTESLPDAQRAKLPVERIRKAFALTDDEMQLLMVVASTALSEPMMRFLTVAWADFAVRQPTVSFAATVVSRTPEHATELVERLSNRGTLIKFRLLVPEPHARWNARTPRLHAPLTIDQRVVDALAAAPLLSDIPAALTYTTRTIRLDRIFVDERLVESLKSIFASPTARVLLLGPRHSGRRTLIGALSRKLLKRGLLEVELTDLLSGPLDKLRVQVADILREALLLDATLLLRADTVEDHDVLAKLPRGILRQLAVLFSDFSGAVVATSPTAERLLSELLADPIELSFPPNPPKRQNIIWRRALQAAMPRDRARWIADTFSNNYQMPTGSIFRAVQQAQHDRSILGLPLDDLQPHDLLVQIRKTFDHNLGALADVAVVETRLRDVVLPDKLKRQVDEVLAYAKHSHTVFDTWGFRSKSPYGNALSILLSGPPGTGKTYLAGAIANELGKVLYKIDLSRVVDKYIGETEKNLGRIFDEASKAQAVLLFDEADSLFAKRTSVKSSNDRYANLEVNYLLQKLESYNGVSILTTNFERGIDEAFMRRIRFGLTFPMPEEEERARLWRSLIPPGAPIERDVDWELLGESFEMSGGHIRNAILRAAIRCASKGHKITFDALLRSGMDEAREMGSLVHLDFDLPDEPH